MLARAMKLKPRIFIGSSEGSPSRIPGRNLENDRRRGFASIMAARAKRATTTQNQLREAAEAVVRSYFYDPLHLNKAVNELAYVIEKAKG